MLLKIPNSFIVHPISIIYQCNFILHRFLFEENSRDYKLYRKLVIKYRHHPELIQEEDKSENSSERSNSPTYQSDVEDDEPAEKKERRDSTDSGLY